MSDTAKVMFHKCKLNSRAITDLRKIGIIPVKVDSLLDIQFLEPDAVSVIGSDLLWAAIDVLGDGRDIPETRKRFCANLAKIMRKYEPKEAQK